jgi:Fe-S cluster biogenesis protein NfuA
MGLITRWLRRKPERAVRPPANLDQPFFLDGCQPPAAPAAAGTSPADCENPDLAARVVPLIESAIRPGLALHAGNCELVDVKPDGTVLLRLTGACHGCSMSILTLKGGIERILKEELPEVTRVEAV